MKNPNGKEIDFPVEELPVDELEDEEVESTTLIPEFITSSIDGQEAPLLIGMKEVKKPDIQTGVISNCLGCNSSIDLTTDEFASTSAGYYCSACLEKMDLD